MSPTPGVKDSWVGATGPVPCDVMIVGEAPGREEVNRGIPFCGSSGDELWEQLGRIVPLSRSQCYVTNVYPYPLQTKERSIRPMDKAMAVDRLFGEIAMVQPRVILALGSIAVGALLPGLRSRYSMECLNALPQWLNDSTIVIPSFHPAASSKNRDTSKLQFLINACRAFREVLRGRMVVEVAQPLKVNSTGVLVASTLTVGATAVDTETRKDNSPWVVSISSKEGEAAFAYADDKASMKIIANHLSKPGITTLLHNALFDLPVLEQCGIVPFRWIDTMSMAFMLQYLPLGLKELAFRLLHIVMPTYEETVYGYDDLESAMAAGNSNRVVDYILGDPDATLRLYNKMLPMAYPRMMENVERDMDIQPMVVEMMRRGIPAKKEFFMDLKREFEAKNFTLMLDIQEFAASNGFKDFNPRSAPQLVELLYKKMQLGKGRKIKRSPLTGKMSTGKKMLARIQDQSTVVSQIIDYKERATLISNFVNKLPKHITPYERIHTDLSMTRIVHSGRFASTKPNLLGIPVRSDDGRRIREGFEMPDGYEFVSGDLSQIEMRVMAHISQDPLMLKVFREGGDIHAQTAERIFGVKPEDQDDYKHRLPSKTAGFGILNKISAYGLSRELIPVAGAEWTVDRCQELLDSWFGVYRGVETHLNNVAGTAKRYGYVYDIWGRRELVPQVYSADMEVVEEGVRIACNQQIQAGAQGVIKQIMRNMWPFMITMLASWWPVLQIHDDVLTGATNDKADYAISVMRWLMEHAVDGWFTVPVKVDMKRGKVWGKMEKVKEAA